MPDRPTSLRLHIPQAPPMKILATCTCLPSIHIYYSVYHINYRQMRNWCKVTANCKHLCCHSNTRRSLIVRCWNTIYKAVFDFKENFWLQVHGATKGSICSRPMQQGRPMAKWVKQLQWIFSSRLYGMVDIIICYVSLNANSLWQASYYCYYM